MDKETIVKHLAQLKAEQDQVQANIVQLQANYNAYLGAIQDCEFWLTQLGAEEKPKE